MKYLDDIPNGNLKGEFFYSLSGVFPANLFRTWASDRTFSGLMFWYCWGNYPGKRRRRLFLAVEPKFDFTYPISDFGIAQRLVPELENLEIPSEVNGHYLNREIGNRRILETSYNRPGGAKNPEDNNGVLNKVQAFLGEPKFSQFNTIGHGYFEKFDEGTGEDCFQSLLGPSGGNPEYIRYYFGFDPEETQNQIRIFLIPANSRGRNILSLNVNNIFQDPTILQKSWPPPPYAVH